MWIADQHWQSRHSFPKKSLRTFPTATAVVAISRTNESPPTPFAASVSGLVPIAGVLALVGYMIGDVFVNANP